MKISELISELKKLKSKHGDFPVFAHDGLDPSELEEVGQIWFEPDLELKGRIIIES